MKEPRWTTVAPSEFPWERAALDYLKRGLPDHEPFHAWSNFEFIADDGSINEVDLLLVSRWKIYLVEIKSHPGRISGDAGTWYWTHDNKSDSFDNPRLLANRKAKKLKSLLQHQKAFAKKRGAFPYIEAVVFLSSNELDCQLEGNARAGVFVADSTRKQGDPRVLDALAGETENENEAGRGVDRTTAKDVARAIEQAGVRAPSSHKRLGELKLGELIQETDLYQDWEATHTQFENTRRRVRIYPDARGSSEYSREERKKAAQREFRFLEGIKHEGILQVHSYVDSERGPALVFEHPQNAQRLNQWLPVDGRNLNVGERLELVRKIAETIQFAHSNRLFHRALSPHSVLVCPGKAAIPAVKLMDWQSARQAADTQSGTRVSVHETAAPAYWGANQAEVFVAPEALAGGGAYDDRKLDVFSLGSLAYYIFSGHPPANSVESLRDKLETHDGLHISDDMDGAPELLVELIRAATCPEVSDRTADVQTFLKDLDDVEDEITRPTNHPNPLDAKPKDVLDGGFTVIRRLGKGSTAVALLVRKHDGVEGVVKVALEPQLNDRIEREGEILAKLRHQNIVELYEQVSISGHAALFMARAGTVSKSAGAGTLAQRIRDEGGLSLDLLQRFGDELLGVVDWLEQNGIPHRDIKPENIGIGETPAKKLTLILFDFSLSSVEPENTRAGTPPYLDPFLSERKPPRWDLYAERYAAAVTLYEMATGNTPVWGDGQSDPVYSKDEIQLDTEHFDPAVREDLTAFFRQALARKPTERFGTAEEMRRAWQRTFEHLDRPTRTTDDGESLDLDSLIDAALPNIRLAMPIGELGLSARLQNAMERLEVENIEDLLKLPRIRLYRNKGIGQRTVADIRHIADRLREHFEVSDHGEAADEAGLDPKFWSIDRLVERLVPAKWETNRARMLRTYLGLEPEGQAPDSFADVRAASERLGVSRPQLDEVIDAARESWQKQKWMSPLRDDIAQIVERHAGVLTLEELTLGLVAHRGSTSQGNLRVARMQAVAAAALEVESQLQHARFTLCRGRRHVYVVGTHHLDERWSAFAPGQRAEYAEQLGDKADALAAEDPLPTPQRVVEALRTVALPENEPELPDDRLIRLAVAASAQAALSSRMEVYPRGMAAVRALRLGHGALIGPKKLGSEQIRKRISSRYPAAEPLPDHPQLDELLESVDSHLQWDASQSAYTVPDTVASLSATATHHSSHGVPESEEEVAALDRRVRQVAEAGRFLALRVPPREMVQVQKRLVTDYGLQLCNLEHQLLRAMREVADKRRVKWEVVLKADAAPHGSVEWTRLLQLVGQAVQAIEPTLLQPERAQLLVNPGLLARYGKVELLSRIRSACEQGKHPGALVLVATSQGTRLPDIDGHALPVVHASEWAQASRQWIKQPAKQQESSENA